ncbi:unnamed protein product, partial [Prorocentrum cordatum]
DASLSLCSAWCRGAAPGSHAALSGSACAHLSPAEQAAGRGPSCTCYDAGYEAVLAACDSRCPEEEGGGVGPAAAAAAAARACPEDANLDMCAAWCEASSPGSRGALAGDTCAHRQAGGEGPSCTCYDPGYEKVLSSCQSRCPRDASGGACPAVDGACQSEPEQGYDGASALRRFLLYDVKRGEGFNLQREVFPRVGWIVWQLNEAAKQLCKGSFGPGRCAQWTLVLPAWCQLAHWHTDSTHIAWRDFFDARALNSTRIPIMEFDEYVTEVGGPHVDFAVSLSQERVPEKERYGRRGGFYGWARRLDSCSSPVPHSWSEESQRWHVEYSGGCEGGVLARELRCGLLSSPLPRDVVDLASAAGSEGATAVLLKGCDAVSPASPAELDSVGLREAMLFAKPIRAAGEEFMRAQLGGGSFLAAHCRRTDFLSAHAKTTPGPAAIAEQINAILLEQDLGAVFVATDAPEDLSGELRGRIDAPVVFLRDVPSVAAGLGHPGKVAAVEMWVAARAAFFVGTSESRFTAHIQLERGWLGKARATSERVLCK